jgi:hypothetical protein
VKVTKKRSRARRHAPIKTFSLADSEGGFEIINALREYADDYETTSSGVVRNLLKKFLKRNGYLE